MSDDPRLESLLLDYQARQGEGRPCSPEEVCAGCPEVLEPLRQRIRELESMEAFLGVRKGSAPAETARYAGGPRDGPAAAQRAADPPPHDVGGADPWTTVSAEPGQALPQPHHGGIAPPGYDVMGVLGK